MTTKSRRVRWAERAAYVGELRNAYKTLSEIFQGKRQLRRPMNKWEDSVTVYL
jgi:hypothetical protein